MLRHSGRWFSSAAAAAVLIVLLLEIHTTLAQTPLPIVINEFMPNPSTGSEWVELFNPNPVAVDLNGWKIDDDTIGGPQTSITAATIPSNSLIVIALTANILNNTGSDAVQLLDAGGATISRRDYSGTSAGQSYACIPDGSSNCSGKASPTPGEWNTQPGPTVIPTDTPVATTSSPDTSVPSEEPTETVAATDVPIDTATPTPTTTPTAVPTSPVPTATPTAVPASPVPTATPTAVPASPVPTATPTAVPASPVPTATPTAVPSSTPTFHPTPITPSYPTGILINEFMPNPGSGNEWVELLNTNSFEVNLVGWKIDDDTSGSSQTIITTSLPMPGNGLVVISLTSNILNNTGPDAVQLLNPAGSVVDRYDYDGTTVDESYARTSDGRSFLRGPASPGAANPPIVPVASSTSTSAPTPTQTSSPIPTEAPTHTLSPTNTATPTHTASPTRTPVPTRTLVPTRTPGPTRTSVPTKTPSPTRVPTPNLPQTSGQTAQSLSLSNGGTGASAGEAAGNSNALAATFASAHVYLNEVLPAPKQQFESEWVEIASSDDITIDLSGWAIDDGEGGSAPYVLPSGSIVVPHGFLLATLPHAMFNNSADLVRLFSPAGRIVDEVSYTTSTADMSNCRLESGDWVEACPPTPGAPNRSAPAAPEISIPTPPPDEEIIQQPLLADRQPADQVAASFQTRTASSTPVIPDTLLHPSSSVEPYTLATPGVSYNGAFISAATELPTSTRTATPRSSPTMQPAEPASKPVVPLGPISVLLIGIGMAVLAWLWWRGRVVTGETTPDDAESPGLSGYDTESESEENVL